MVSRYTDRPATQNPHPPPSQYNSAVDPNNYYGNFNAPPGLSLPKYKDREMFF